MLGELVVPLGGLYSFLLLLARVAGAISFVPLPGIAAAPAAARIVLVVVVAFALLPVAPALSSAPPSPGLVVVWMLAELALGTAIGLTVACLNEVFLLGAQIVGFQAGYSFASTIDPMTEADSTVLQILAQLWAGLLFFTLGLDRQVLRAFAASLETIPPGAYVPKLSSAGMLLKLSGGIFSAGMRLALPVATLLLLIDVALGLFGKLQAQLQLLGLAFPLKMLGALAMLALVAPVFAAVYQRYAEQGLRVLYAVVGHGG